jgi:hypothetical protein
MPASLMIREMFKISGGVTVLACDQPPAAEVLAQRAARIESESGEVRQQIKLLGVRTMSGPAVRPDLVAIDTRDSVELTVEEARSGKWRLIVV